MTNTQEQTHPRPAVTSMPLDGMRHTVVIAARQSYLEVLAEQAPGQPVSAYEDDLDAFVRHSVAMFDAGVQEIKAQVLNEAADAMERHAQRTDVRLTEHVLVEHGGPAVLREYAEMISAGKDL